MSCIIKGVVGRRVWDSRGWPTVEVELRSTTGHVARCISPSGASRGSNEAVELRDGGPAFGGWGVDRAVQNVNSLIRGELLGMDATQQKTVDQMLVELDGTHDKSRLGGNAIVAASMATLHLAAAYSGVPTWRYVAAGKQVRIPLPEVQIFGGGAHANRCIDIQDFMVIPLGASTFDEALVWVAEVYRTAGIILEQTNRRMGVADEGGWWPMFQSNEEALQILTQAIEQAGFHFEQVAIALDVAASQFGSGGRYKVSLDKREYTQEQWLEVIVGWTRRYPILSIEDPFAEDDAAGMQAITAAIGNHVQIVGDDFLVTNAARIAAAAEANNCNAVLIKPNQAGTFTESYAALTAAQLAGFSTIVSARSGETEDVSVAHLAVGWDAGQLKVGSFARSERMAKWNEVLRIEAELGPQAVFAGADNFPQR